VHPLDHWEEIPPSANGQVDPKGEFVLLASQGKGLGCTKGPTENQLRSTLCTGKNPGSNSGLPQEAEGEIDHLPKTTTNHLLG
jgi:hypothetical protein